MRIAYLCGDRGVPVNGTKGASIHVRGIIRALAARGHEIHLVATREEETAPALPHPVLNVGFDRVLKDVQRAMIDAGAEPVLAGEMYALLVNLRACRALASLNRRAPLDAVYERYSLWSWAGMHFARERGVPWMLEVNAPLLDEQRAWRDLSLQPVGCGLERVLLRAADAIVVPSDELRAYVARRAGRRRRVLVIPNGVDLDLFDRPPGPLPPEGDERLRGRFVVVFLGTLKPWHGVRTLLRAFARLRRSVPRAHLLIIGDGPMRGEVERAARRLGSDAITACGAVPHEAVPSWLARADVGVAPYPALRDFYFSPLKVVEYLAAGLPVVASAIGQIPSLVRDGRTGLLVRPGDESALAASLARLEADGRLRARLARRAREDARRRHGWSRAAARIEAALAAIALRRARRPAAVAPGAASLAEGLR